LARGDRYRAVSRRADSEGIDLRPPRRRAPHPRAVGEREPIDSTAEMREAADTGARFRTGGPAGRSQRAARAPRSRRRLALGRCDPDAGRPDQVRAAIVGWRGGGVRRTGTGRVRNGRTSSSASASGSPSRSPWRWTCSRPRATTASRRGEGACEVREEARHMPVTSYLRKAVSYVGQSASASLTPSSSRLVRCW
jgi:hypothetical protein